MTSLHNLFMRVGSCEEIRLKILREKICRKREREGAVWTCRCDIPTEMKRTHGIPFPGELINRLYVLEISVPSPAQNLLEPDCFGLVFFGNGLYTDASELVCACL